MLRPRPILSPPAWERHGRPGGAELCLLAGDAPLTPEQREDLATYRAEVSREGVPVLTQGDRRPCRETRPPPPVPCADAVAVRVGGRTWNTATDAAAALGVGRRTVQAMARRERGETPRERGRRAAAEFARALEDAA